ncbi:phosphosulfolactate phosphohydrolase [Microbacterium sp.]|uniref:phosphosulfolactate phosphohydrolase n=1 Tax=Microbacterium sp. TaxID=51671 RepID=UPI003A87F04F
MPFSQTRYQVRFDWGAAGLARVEPADVTVIVDVLGTDVVARVAAGETVDAPAPLARTAAGGSLVLWGALCNATAVAEAIGAHQRQRQARTSVAVIAVGDPASAPADAPVRFAVEDLLGAGAIVDALSTVGIDHSSPEAAAAAVAFQGLRGAVRHLLAASDSGSGADRDAVRDAATIDGVPVVPVLGARGFHAHV